MIYWFLIFVFIIGIIFIGNLVVYNNINKGDELYYNIIYAGDDTELPYGPYDDVVFDIVSNVQDGIVYTVRGRSFKFIDFITHRVNLY